MDNTNGINPNSINRDFFIRRETKLTQVSSEIAPLSSAIKRTSAQRENALSQYANAPPDKLSHHVHLPERLSNLVGQRAFMPSSLAHQPLKNAISSSSQIDLEKAMIAYQLSDVKVIVEENGVLIFKPAIDPYTGKNNVENMAHIARVNINEKGEKELLVHASSPWTAQTHIVDEEGKECLIRVGLQDEEIAHMTALLNEYNRLTLLQSAATKTKEVAPQAIGQHVKYQTQFEPSRKLTVVVKKPLQQMQKLLSTLILIAIRQDRKDQDASKEKDRAAEAIIRDAIKVDLRKAEIASDELEKRGLKS